MSATGHTLCICMTPLHVLIAKQIARTQGMRFTHGLYITSALNDKSRYYADQMHVFCDALTLIEVPGDQYYPFPKHLHILLRRIKAVRRFRQLGVFETVYIPSSISHYVYAAVSAARARQLFSFDDGLLNIEQPSRLRQHRTSWSNKLLLRAAGIDYWPEKLIQRSQGHFSLYDAPNAYGRVTRISLGDSPSLQTPGTGQSQARSVVRILIGLAPEAHSSAQEAIQRAVQRYQPNYYLPHPRASISAFDGVQTLETALIAEDYVLDLLQRDPNVCIEIFGYESSVLINLARVQGVTTYTLMHDTAAESEARALMLACGVKPAP